MCCNRRTVPQKGTRSRGSDTGRIGAGGSDGAYIHVTPETIAKAKKTNVLARALECAIPEEVYENLEKLIQ